MSQQELNALVEFFKVLGNENRLKIIGILASGECTVREIAEMLRIKEPSVSEHLNALKEVGLVKVRPDGNHRIYSFNPDPLRMLNRELFSRERLSSLVDGVVDASERKILQAHFQGDRLVRVPSSRKNWLVVLKWFAEQFEIGQRYPEKQVNEIILRHHEDYALIRRDLVDFGFMTREKSVYWRTPEQAPAVSVKG
ncbi:metalloregulator ArsR/SmtB family transcription factor [Kamptonema cortianum]|nr:metalloregulator ArsR/SmtB family transcription factor [Kamptonema cortianum]